MAAVSPAEAGEVVEAEAGEAKIKDSKSKIKNQPRKRKMNKHLLKYISKDLLLLFLVFFLAFAVRTYRLGELPHGFFVEEMTNTYVGRFILQFGKDLYGNSWPLLYFDKFGDYPPVLPLYFSGLSTFIFGMTEFAGRFPMALFGALFVFPVYFLMQLALREKKIAIFIAFLAALMPWHVVLSRTTAEGVIAFTVFAYALSLFFTSVINKKKHLFFISLFLFVLTYFLYPSFRIIAPLSFLPLPILLKSFKGQTMRILLATIFFFMLTLSVAATPWGRARFNQTSLFTNQDMANSILLSNTNLSNGEGPGRIIEARIFHNKLTGYVRAFLYQYLSYFSPYYLFLEAGGQPRYYNVPDQGLLYVTVIPFLILALFSKRDKSSTVYLLYFVYLLAIAPIPAAITVDFTPHVHRSIFMILPFLMIAGYGITAISHIRWKRFSPFLIVIVCLILMEFIRFWHQYENHSDSVQSVLRNDGDREVMKYVIDHKKEYDAVIMPVLERLPLYYLFYSNTFSPSLIGKFKTELKIDQIDTITFVDGWCPSFELAETFVQKKTLVVDNSQCKPTNLKMLKKIMRKDSTEAYRLYTTK